jgi:putative radical SAM enzyme (TIGR03279 family)
VIPQVQALQVEFKATLGSTFAWLADEWFLIAQTDLPPESHYEDYPQIGNGVGSIRQFIRDFATACDRLLPSQIPTPKTWLWVVGNAVEQAFQPLVTRLNQVENLTVELVPLRSDYWGQDITVTGLLTGQDVITGLGDRPTPGPILLPAVMLKHDDTRFLDDLTVTDVAQTLGRAIVPVAGIDALLKTLASHSAVA